MHMFFWKHPATPDLKCEQTHTAQTVRIWANQQPVPSPDTVLKALRGALNLSLYLFSFPLCVCEWGSRQKKSHGTTKNYKYFMEEIWKHIASTWEKDFLTWPALKNALFAMTLSHLHNTFSWRGYWSIHASLPSAGTIVHVWEKPLLKSMQHIIRKTSLRQLWSFSLYINNIKFLSWLMTYLYNTAHENGWMPPHNVLTRVSFVEVACLLQARTLQQSRIWILQPATTSLSFQVFGFFFAERTQSWKILSWKINMRTWWTTSYLLW